MGVLNSVRIRCIDLDAVVVDLDIGAVYVPPSITIPVIPLPFCQQLTSSLQLVSVCLQQLKVNGSGVRPAFLQVAFCLFCKKSTRLGGGVFWDEIKMSDLRFH